MNSNLTFQISSSQSTPIMNKRPPFKPSYPSIQSNTVESHQRETTKQHNRPVTHFANNTINKRTGGVPRVNVLRESRLHQTFQYHAKGRLKSHRVGFAIYGPPHAHPVFVIGGYGCTRLVGVMFEELAYRYGLKMIWPERPGYGLSEDCNSQDMTALDWANVIIQLADYLNIKQFSMIAQSVGTVFALAIAHKYPSYVLGPIFLISPWVSTQAANTFKWTRRLPAPLVAKTISLALDVMWVFNRTKEEQVMSEPSSPVDHRQTLMVHEEDELLASLDEDLSDLTTDFPTDRPLRHMVRPKHMSLYLAMNNKRMAEPHNQGQISDVMVALEKYHMFGFNYSDIKMSVSAVWGDKDGLIPQKAIETFANTLHDVRLKILESEGHDLVWKEGVMEWAIRGIAERWRN